MGETIYMRQINELNNTIRPCHYKYPTFDVILLKSIHVLKCLNPAWTLPCKTEGIFHALVLLNAFYKET